MDDSLRRRERRLPAGNTATGALKLIALVFMLIDHCGKVLFNNLPAMRQLGRIAFPVYVWCMVVGFCYTRNVWRYMLRVLVVGLVSQPLYMIALEHGWNGADLAGSLAHLGDSPNVFLTLLLGLFALWGIREKKALSQLWAPAAAMLLASLLHADYGWRGVLLMILLYAVRDSRSGIAAVMVSFFLYWGSFYGVSQSFLGIPIRLENVPAFLADPLRAFLRMETYGLLCLPLLLIPFPRDVKMPRWVGYALYPAHLLLIILLKAEFPGC